MLPLSSDLLAQFSTADNHDLHGDRRSASGPGDVINLTPPERIQSQLHQDSHDSNRQDADVSNFPFVSDEMNIDEDAHQGEELAQLPEANLGCGARDVLHDTVASVSETADDAEPIGDAVVVQDITQAQPAVMQATSSTQRDNQSEHRDFDAASGAEVEFDAHQMRHALQSSESLDIDTCQTAAPTQVTGNEAHEPESQNLVNKFETTTSPTDNDSNALRAVFFRLYLDEEADPLEPQCCVKLTGFTTRDELFTMMHDDLQDDLLTGDQIVAVKVKRADGEVFRGPNARTMPIKTVGQQDMWRELINTLLEHGAGESIPIQRGTVLCLGT